MNTTDSYLNINETVKRAGISRARIYILMKESRFPCSVLLSGPTEKRRVAWRAADVESWRLAWPTAKGKAT